MPTVRAADQAEDRARIARIDTSFQTDRIYRVTAGPAGFRLDEEPAHPPRTKVYPVALEDLGEGLVVAEDDGELVGFGEVVLKAWNRRTTIVHLHVSPSSRGSGFRLCGLDDTLYDPELDPTTGSDEVALFFTRPL